MEKLKVAVLFISFGPYHFARARALAAVDGLAPYFIQFAASVKSHPWRVDDACAREIGLTTLSDRPFEQSSYFDLTNRLRATLDRINPTAVVTSSYRPFVMLAAARWAKIHQRRAIVFFDSTPWDRPRYPVIEAGKRAVLQRYYDAAFVGGIIHRDYLTSLGVPGDRIWQPYNVIDNDYFAQAALRIAADRDRWHTHYELPKHYFLYVGRFAPEKNLKRLVEAYLKYRKDGGEWSLVLVGDGPETAEVRRLSAAGGGSILVRPFAQADDLAAFYALAGCLVLPSTSEPWGLVVNEAMACGLPVVVSQCCGCLPELVIERENGFSFDPYDVPALAGRLAAVSLLGQEIRSAMGDLSRRIISRFSPQRWAVALGECVRTVSGECNARAKTERAGEGRRM